MFIFSFSYVVNPKPGSFIVNYVYIYILIVLEYSYFRYSYYK